MSLKTEILSFQTDFDERGPAKKRTIWLEVKTGYDNRLQRVRRERRVVIPRNSQHAERIYRTERLGESRVSEIPAPLLRIRWTG